MGDRKDILSIKADRERLEVFFGLRLISLTIYPEEGHRDRYVK